MCSCRRVVFAAVKCLLDPDSVPAILTGAHQLDANTPPGKRACRGRPLWCGLEAPQCGLSATKTSCDDLTFLVRGVSWRAQIRAGGCSGVGGRPEWIVVVAVSQIHRLRVCITADEWTHETYLNRPEFRLASSVFEARSTLTRSGTPYPSASRRTCLVMGAGGLPSRSRPCFREPHTPLVPLQPVPCRLLISSLRGVTWRILERFRTPCDRRALV
jgi:hypothetical protein